MNITLAGVRATNATIRVPQIGAWVADVALGSADAIPSGKVTLGVGSTNFVGTVDPKFSGAFSGRRTVRLVAGANGWANVVAARHFHNDAGVKDRTVIQATADEAGETLSFDATATSIGADFVRPNVPASMVLHVLAGQGWYVDYSGVTHVGPRTVAPLGKFDVLDFDASENLLTTGTSEAQAIGIGAVISDRLDKPFTVRSLVIKVDAESARVTAWGTT